MRPPAVGRRCPLLALIVELRASRVRLRAARRSTSLGLIRRVALLPAGSSRLWPRGALGLWRPVDAGRT